MAAREWKTLSVKVDEETRNLIELNCRRESTTVNKFLSDLITHDVEPLRNPSVLPENKGIPQIGENRFKYNPESDSFSWQINLGVSGTFLLSETVSPVYLENLRKAMDAGLSQRSEFLSNNKKGAVIPQKLLKYGVKKHAGTGT